jgi:ADP-ribose pyrophosphatase
MEHQIRSRETRYTAHTFTVEKVQVTLPDGREGNYDLVAHIGSVTILPVDDDGNIYFVKQYRIGPQQVLLELPAGTLNSGESPMHCAERELKEETGMAADTFTALGDIFLAPGYASEHMHLYLAKNLYPSPAKGDDDEFIQVEKIPVRKAYAMAASNEIHDSKTLAIMLLALPFLSALLEPAAEGD